MKDKLSRKYVTKFDRIARKLGIIGSVIIVSTIALGVSLIVTLDHQNDLLVEEVNRNTNILDNLQLQYENGNVLYVD